MDTGERGRIGEASIIKFFVEQGYSVFMPMFGNAPCDLIVTLNNEISRVEVKATGYLKDKSYVVQLRSMRYNNTQTVSKKFDGSKSDLLAVYIVPEDRVVLFESKELDGRSTLSVRATGM
jgi:hypothetical protein